MSAVILRKLLPFPKG